MFPTTGIVAALPSIGTEVRPSLGRSIKIVRQAKTVPKRSQGRAASASGSMLFW